MAGLIAGFVGTVVVVPALLWPDCDVPVPEVLPVLVWPVPEVAPPVWPVLEVPVAPPLVPPLWASATDAAQTPAKITQSNLGVVITSFAFKEVSRLTSH